ncbi:protein AAR2 homolog [Saccostrea echinata]|uniref:protein AAR2 homolog n=1 Tax=Saccostrea echinata TaxID=191078 RepID=UPI002A7FBCCA|nr:protein AAR2 homolog [Saccostrea echinata]
MATLDMDQETAQVLFHEGATLVCLDVPEGTEFGIDYSSWTVGEKFKGVKMIPPGIHFVYCSARDRQTGEVCPRSGSFINFQQKGVIVRKWDGIKDDLTEDNVSAVDVQRIQDNLKELDRFLGPYPYDKFKKWVSLSNFITPELVDKLQPLSKTISSVTDFVSEVSNTQTRRSQSTSSQAKKAKLLIDKTESMEDDTQGNQEENAEPASLKEAESKLPDMKVREESKIRFSPIPKLKYPPGSSPAEMTKYSMDSSYVLESILSSCYHDSEMGILGEIQFAFICFLIGQVLDAFEQWKNLVHVMCSSEESLAKHSALFSNFIGVLHFHIQETPEDFFVDILSENNFLTSTLQVFFSNLENISNDSGLRKKGLKFRDYLTQKFKWDFTSEPDEYAPTIVQLE